jgi:cytochrome c peroxidase
VAYASFSPAFGFDTTADDYVGGQFYDGRARDLADQVKGPFLNPAEMNLPNIAEVVKRVKRSTYKHMLVEQFGKDIFKDVTTCFQAITSALVAYQSSAEVNRFSSKFDAFLRGQSTLTSQEIRGMLLFTDPNKGNCAACHPVAPRSSNRHPLLTDFTYDNLGIPRHTDQSDRDPGLGAALQDSAHYGRFKVPTLRNVELTAPYMHNGFFATLEEVVDFYNKRDVKTFAPPEYPTHMNRDELGDLKLTDSESADIVAFLKTLTDGYVVPTQGGDELSTNEDR